MPDPFLKQYLMTAGPTPLPPAVSQAMAQPMLYHRAPAFVPVYARALARLRLVFQTSGEVLLFECDDYIGRPLNLAARFCAAATQS